MSYELCSLEFIMWEALEKDESYSQDSKEGDPETYEVRQMRIKLLRYAQKHLPKVDPFCLCPVMSMPVRALTHINRSRIKVTSHK